MSARIRLAPSAVAIRCARSSRSTAASRGGRRAGRVPSPRKCDRQLVWAVQRFERGDARPTGLDHRLPAARCSSACKSCANACEMGKHDVQAVGGPPYGRQDLGRCAPPPVAD